jgi:hypothetical protein
MFQKDDKEEVMTFDDVEEPLCMDNASQLSASNIEPLADELGPDSTTADSIVADELCPDSTTADSIVVPGPDYELQHQSAMDVMIEVDKALESAEEILIGLVKEETAEQVTSTVLKDDMMQLVIYLF